MVISGRASIHVDASQSFTSRCYNKQVFVHFMHVCTCLAPPVPEATSNNLVFGGASNMATNSLFHSRCSPIDMRSFITSYFLATLVNTSFTALRQQNGDAGHQASAPIEWADGHRWRHASNSVRCHSWTFCGSCSSEYSMSLYTPLCHKVQWLTLPWCSTHPSYACMYNHLLPIYTGHRGLGHIKSTSPWDRHFTCFTTLVPMTESLKWKLKAYCQHDAVEAHSCTDTDSKLSLVEQYITVINT